MKTKTPAYPPETHTAGANRAAKIIMGDDERIFTTYGPKTLEGLADLIDRETAAPDLLAACEDLLAAYHGLTLGRQDTEWEGQFKVKARAAIAKAKGVV